MTPTTAFRLSIYNREQPAASKKDIDHKSTFHEGNSKVTSIIQLLREQKTFPRPPLVGKVVTNMSSLSESSWGSTKESIRYTRARKVQPEEFEAPTFDGIDFYTVPLEYAAIWFVDSKKLLNLVLEIEISDRGLRRSWMYRTAGVWRHKEVVSEAKLSDKGLEDPILNKREIEEFNKILEPSYIIDKRVQFPEVTMWLNHIDYIPPLNLVESQLKQLNACPERSLAIVKDSLPSQNPINNPQNGT